MRTLLLRFGLHIWKVLRLRERWLPRVGTRPTGEMGPAPTGRLWGDTGRAPGTGESGGGRGGPPSLAWEGGARWLLPAPGLRPRGSRVQGGPRPERERGAHAACSRDIPGLGGKTHLHTHKLRWGLNNEVEVRWSHSLGRRAGDSWFLPPTRLRLSPPSLRPSPCAHVPRLSGWIKW